MSNVQVKQNIKGKKMPLFLSINKSKFFEPNLHCLPGNFVYGGKGGDRAPHITGADAVETFLQRTLRHQYAGCHAVGLPFYGGVALGAFNALAVHGNRRFAQPQKIFFVDYPMGKLVGASKA
jgi:hypothetical protein